MSILGETTEIIKVRFKTLQYMNLGSVGHWHDLGDEPCTLAMPDVEECMGHDPLQLLEQDLHNALEQVVYMKLHVDHTPFYSENGFCTVCGWDGNA